MKKIILAYIPVLHEGYQAFFSKHSDVKTLYLLDKNFLSKKFKQIYKDIRALDTQLIKKSLLAWERFDEIKILTEKNCQELAKENCLFIMPNEELMRELTKEYLGDLEIDQISFDAIFLRWDKHNSTQPTPVTPNLTISQKEFDQKMMHLAFEQSDKSADFWRHIGAVIVKDSKIILTAHNHHVPDEQQPYIDGDPRSDYSQGVCLELSTAIHAEANLIAEAARKGISLDGAEIYVTTFPCPVCAKQIAYSGIKKVYFNEDYGVLDGERILKAKGVEIVWVKMDKKTSAREKQYSHVKNYCP